MESKLDFFVAASLGAEVAVSLFGIEASGFIGLYFDWKMEYTLDCVNRLNGTKAEIGAKAEYSVKFPAIIALILDKDKFEDDYNFFNYTLKPLQGCYLDPTPKSEKPASLPVLPCTAVFDGQIYDLSGIVR